MAVDRQAPISSAPSYAPSAWRDRLAGGGTTGNERLTTATGAILIVLLAIIGLTILRLQGLLSVHLFVGMLLIPPVLLKIGSTGYRFLRYYTANRPYRMKGPPEIVMRLIAPAVVLTTVVVFASGVALLFAGPSSRDTLLPVHKVSFVAWGIFFALHVLGHLPAMPAVLRAEYGRSERWSSDVTGRTGRTIALAGALVAGVVLALITIPEFAPWLHSAALHHHDG